jgi:hypothetical protein
MIVRKQRGKHVSSKKICRVAKAVGIVGNPLQTNVTLRDAKPSFRAADEEYRLLKLRAPMMRSFCVTKPETRLSRQLFGSMPNKHWDTNVSGTMQGT